MQQTQAIVSDLIPSAPPPPDAITIIAWTHPQWIMPIAYAVGTGQGSHDAINGIGIDDYGDLVLYRKIQPQDCERHPQLIGVDEVWITIQLPMND